MKGWSKKSSQRAVQRGGTDEMRGRDSKKVAKRLMRLSDMILHFKVF